MLTQTMVFGIILSLIYYEWVGLSPGGVIVPGYLVLYLQQPERIVATLVTSLIVYGLGKLIDNWTILYGRQKFGVYILLGILLDWILGQGLVLPFAEINLYSIGLLIPGIIALDFERQGVFQTLLSMSVVIGLLYLITICLKILGVGV